MFQVIVFFEDIYGLLAILTLTFVGAFAMKVQGRNPLGWGFLVPLYCLMIYGIVPSLLHGFGIKNDYENLDGMVEALLLVSGFIIIFSITYLLAERILHVLAQGRKFSLLEGAPFSVMEWPLASYVIFPIAAYALRYSYAQGYFGLQAAEGVGAFAGLASVGQLLLVLWFCYVAARFWDRKERDRFAIPLLLSLGLMALLGILGNSKGAMIAPIVILGLSRYANTGRFPFGLVSAALAILVFVAFPIVSTLRAESMGRSADILGDLSAIFGLFSELASDPAGMYTTLEHIDRSLLIILSNAVSSIGSGMSLMYGDTYGHALATFVPRILWPGKPDMDIGNLIGHQFGFLAVTDLITSISAGFIGELYMNFGAAGCLIGAGTFGIFAVILDALIVGNSKYGKVFFAINILWLEGTIGHTIFPFIKGMVVVATLLFLLMGARRVFGMASRR